MGNIPDCCSRTKFGFEVDANTDGLPRTDPVKVNSAGALCDGLAQHSHEDNNNGEKYPSRALDAFPPGNEESRRRYLRLLDESRNKKASAGWGSPKRWEADDTDAIESTLYLDETTAYHGPLTDDETEATDVWTEDPTWSQHKLSSREDLSSTRKPQRRSPPNARSHSESRKDAPHSKASVPNSTTTSPAQVKKASVSNPDPSPRSILKVTARRDPVPPSAKAPLTQAPPSSLAGGEGRTEAPPSQNGAAADEALTAARLALKSRRYLMKVDQKRLSKARHDFPQ